MRKVTVIMLSGLLLVGGAFLLQAQDQDEKPTFESTLVKQWENIQGKLLKMAADEQFPEDKFDYRPHPDSRSWIEEIWHVTSSAEAVNVICHGEEPDFGKIFTYDGRPRDRAKMVAAFEKANMESAAALAKMPTPQIIGWIRHSAEHYGKIVGIYRENGIVPPHSRPEEGEGM